MDSIDLNGIYESYIGIYEDVEDLDEAKEDEGLSRKEKIEKRNKRLGMKTKERRSEHTWARGERGNYGVEGDRYKATKTNKGNYPSIKMRGRGFTDPGFRDHYDIVLEYLLDGGLCESVENAEIMMAHMSEAWIDGILDEVRRFGGEVDPVTGQYTGRINPQLKTNPRTPSGPSGMKTPPLKKAEAAHNRAKESGDFRRANQIRTRALNPMNNTRLQRSMAYNKGKAEEKRRLQSPADDDN